MQTCFLKPISILKSELKMMTADDGSAFVALVIGWCVLTALALIKKFDNLKVCWTMLFCDIKTLLKSIKNSFLRVAISEIHLSLPRKNWSVKLLEEILWICKINPTQGSNSLDTSLFFYSIDSNLI